ncbi:MAG: 16S rRNA (cytosine(1402)-N(4))-methyltransferase RsmH [Magnetococcales bacterium]|nr:16S rRNA (cytosine(1402)-N(4))-methyltransferase RsmH [Magnetococcales bacterium]MBF0348583.1 16S rRNA (cytosine(1402)-N(4))-methyltransferase RsmH [Magnetococcales bacterium]
MRSRVQEGGHLGVMIAEVVAGLEPVAGKRYLDATFGSGGHAMALLDASAPDGQVLGLDRDPAAIERGQSVTDRYGGRIRLYETPFADLATALSEHGWDRIDGAIFDLGVSSQQLDTAQRGFSFRFDGPLDMRMDQGRQTQKTAAHLVNELDVTALTRLFFQLGEEPHAKRAARAIVLARSREPLQSTRQLATLLEEKLPGGRPGLHPATRVFQALRMAVNQELEQLEQGIQAAMRHLAWGGRLAVISFHSLEDRLVKHVFKAASTPPPVEGPLRLLPHVRLPAPPFELVTRKPRIPGENELRTNPRARSAKLRIIQRRAPS